MAGLPSLRSRRLRPMRPTALIRRVALQPLALLPLALLLALPATACERHLQGHQNSSSTAQEASQR